MCGRGARALSGRAPSGRTMLKGWIGGMVAGVSMALHVVSGNLLAPWLTSRASRLNPVTVFVGVLAALRTQNDCVLLSEHAVVVSTG